MNFKLAFVMVVSTLCLAVVWCSGIAWDQWTIPHFILFPVEVKARAKYQSKVEGYFSQPKELDIEPSRLIYLVQTEGCIPYHLRFPRAIGNASACQCDVLVLSYKRMCTLTPPVHVEYIFNSSTTWNSGRNLLFQTARQRNEKYLYYTFVDDDIHLQTKTGENPWRMYEKFVRRIEPVIGIVDINERPGLKRTLKGRMQQGCSSKEVPEYLPAVYFDPAFNSFHYQAIDSFLPYPVKFDSISWWFTSWYTMMKAEVMFPGQAVIHTGLTALNPMHRPYPRGQPNQSVWDTLVNDLKSYLPQKYRNVQMLRKWKQVSYVRSIHLENSSTLCLSPPPHMPIKPFAYLEDINQT